MWGPRGGVRAGWLLLEVRAFCAQQSCLGPGSTQAGVRGHLLRAVRVF